MRNILFNTKPRIVINVSSEEDIVNAVKGLGSANIPFLVQNGGSGWSSSFDIGDGAIINMAKLNTFSLSRDKKLATIGGGAKINETIDDAFKNGVQVVTGNCNCVGTLGALLGGGYGNLMGLHGFGVDTVHSLRVVLANGEAKTISKDHDPDLFWGFRGAGPNLGVIVSATVSAFPTSDMNAWVGAAGFAPDKLEQVIQLLENHKLLPQTNIFLYFMSSGPPANTPMILLTFFYYQADDTTARQFFKPFYDMGPMFTSGQSTSYPQWNSAGEPFFVRGARKPCYGASFQKLTLSVWKTIWDDYVEFQKRPGAERSIVLLEKYNLDRAREFPEDSAAFPHRNVNFHAMATPVYDGTDLDSEANTFGAKVRDLWRATDGLEMNSTYINVAFGDEPNEIVYGRSIERLRALKARVDPENLFDQWFNIVTGGTRHGGNNHGV